MEIKIKRERDFTKMKIFLRHDVPEARASSLGRDKSLLV